MRASARIRQIEQEIYALAREVEATEDQKRRIDGAVETLFAILDLDRDLESTGTEES